MWHAKNTKKALQYIFEKMGGFQVQRPLVPRLRKVR
jgi:hypothetical protein